MFYSVNWSNQRAAKLEDFSYCSSREGWWFDAELRSASYSLSATK